LCLQLIMPVLVWVEAQASRLEFKPSLFSSLPAHLASSSRDLEWKPQGIQVWSTAHIVKSVQLCNKRFTHLSNCRDCLLLRSDYEETLCWLTWISGWLWLPLDKTNLAKSSLSPISMLVTIHYFFNNKIKNTLREIKDHSKEVVWSSGVLC